MAEFYRLKVKIMNRFLFFYETKRRRFRYSALKSVQPFRLYPRPGVQQKVGLGVNLAPHLVLCVLKRHYNSLANCSFLKLQFLLTVAVCLQLQFAVFTHC